MDFQIELGFYRKRVPAYRRTARAFCISLFCILTLCQCKSSTPKESNAAAENMSEVTAVKAPLTPAKILDSASISVNEGIRAIDWMTINADFMTNCLNPFLASRRIKSDCTQCNKIMFSFSFVIDGKGKIQTISKESEIINCTRMNETDKKKLRKEILIYIKKLVLPASFYKCIYRGSLGFILKC